MKLVGVETGGIIETHIPDYSGVYETFCGLDGDDPNHMVKQFPAEPGTQVDCEHCIAAWNLARKIKPSQIKQ